VVEQQKPLEGGSWTVSALYLQGISLVRRNNEWHHLDPLGTAQVITNSSAQVVSNNVYDTFGVLRYQQGSAQTPWRWNTARAGNEDIYEDRESHAWLLSRGVFPLRACALPMGILPAFYLGPWPLPGPACPAPPRPPSRRPAEPGYWSCFYQCVTQFWNNYWDFVPPPINWGCVAANVCCLLGGAPCCPVATVRDVVNGAVLLTIIKACLVKCLVDRKPVPPLTIQPCAQ
jgi:hypothetical protein